MDVLRRDEPAVLWSPPPDVRETTEVGRYLAWLERERGLAFADYDELPMRCPAPPGSRALG